MTEDLADFDVVQVEEDIPRLRSFPKIGVVAQTTQPIEKVEWLVGLMRGQLPRSEVRFVDTVCQPTKQRQLAAMELARECDVVIVIGGEHSNNTRELALTCGRFCARVHQVRAAEDLGPDWLVGARTVGITAGTSTPDSVVDQVEQWLREFADFQARLRQHLALQPT